jgi:serine/threonine protein kinase
MIMDWGNARLYNTKPYYDYLSQHLESVKLANLEKEAENIILGTPHYMSPEQTDHSREELTPSSDIFSAGIILYQMLTGVHPFTFTAETREIMKQIRDYNPKPAHSINSDIPVRLSIICQNMLEKDRSLRYKSLKDVLEDLDGFFTSGQAFLTRTYQPGETIVLEGEAGDYSFKIISGIVEVTKMVEGKQKVLAQLGKGEIFGELAIFTKQPRIATVKAIEPTTIRVMDKESVEKELEKLSPWVGNMITGLSRRFIELNEKLVEMDN